MDIRSEYTPIHDRYSFPLNMAAAAYNRRVYLRPFRKVVSFYGDQRYGVFGGWGFQNAKKTRRDVDSEEYSAVSSRSRSFVPRGQQSRARMRISGAQKRGTPTFSRTNRIFGRANLQNWTKNPPKYLIFRPKILKSDQNSSENSQKYLIFSRNFRALGLRTPSAHQRTFSAHRTKIRTKFDHSARKKPTGARNILTQTRQKKTTGRTKLTQNPRKIPLLGARTT